MERVKCAHNWDDPSNHGRCTKCGAYCGCSFMPTSLNDFCDEHRPRPRQHDAMAFNKARGGMKL